MNTVLSRFRRFIFAIMALSPLIIVSWDLEAQRIENVVEQDKVVVTDAGIGELVIYGDNFDCAGSFMASAIPVRNAWAKFGEENGERPGSYLIRNAQRRVKPCIEDAKFVQQLAWNTFRLKYYRVIVLSKSQFKRQTIEGIGFYPISDKEDQDAVMRDLLRWYRKGYWPEEKR